MSNLINVIEEERLFFQNEPLTVHTEMTSLIEKHLNGAEAFTISDFVPFATEHLGMTDTVAQAALSLIQSQSEGHDTIDPWVLAMTLIRSDLVDGQLHSNGNTVVTTAENLAGYANLLEVEDNITTISSELTDLWDENP